jgi:oligopeptide transport system substrate-binding protein
MKKAILFLLIAALFVASLVSIHTQVVAETPTPGTFQPFPTATAYVTPSPSVDTVYINSDYGFSITTADNITAANEDPTNGVFQSYTMGDSEGFGWLFPATMTAGEAIKDVAKDVYKNESSSFTKIEVLKDEEIALANGKNAWYTQFRGYDSTHKYTVEVRLYTVVHIDRAFTVEFYSLPSIFVSWNLAITKMVNSITFFTPTVMGQPRNQVLILEGGESSNPQEYDPATTHGGGDYLIFEGLVTYNQKLEIVPALAASWDVSADGTVYTFHLQPKAVFHNGKPVTAKDVVYSWERAADPKTNSDTVMTYMSDIVGVKEMHDGSADHISGLKVIDDHTLQVTIDAAKPYFLYKLTYPTGDVVDQANVESGNGWYRTPNGTGPYRLVRWDSMERMIYQRFDDYYGAKPAIPMIIYTLYSGDEFRLYQEGAVDLGGVSSYDIERVTDPTDPLSKELVTGVSLCTSYIQFDVTKPPFDDVKVRQAFILAFDKTKYLDVVLKDSDVPAKGLYPPALPGYNLDLKGYDYDPARARELIKESKYGSVDAFPEIIFTTSGYASDPDSLVAAMSQMWKQNLGVDITVQNLDPAKMVDQSTREDYGQLTSSGWCADYPDPENFADVLFHTGADMNKGNYSNPELDQILEKARIEPNVDQRIKLYQQAEQIIVDDAAAIFLYHSNSYIVVKPYVKGYTLSPISTYPVLRYVSLDQNYWK